MAIRTAVNRALTAITALPTAAALVDGNLTLLTTATASSSATLDFTSSIDSTYDSYMFKFIDIHPATDDTRLTFQSDTGTNTNYNQTITSTCFQAKHSEADDDSGLAYQAGNDQQQGTGFQRITDSIGNANDASAVGSLHIFNPSSSTFVKHFICRTQHMVGASGVGSKDLYYAGYFNTTTAITRVQFKMASGNIDAGVIKMYGVGDKQS
tara:strand:- start:490 stop:1119 length:630 start_codon:yes stop_codon:yes gene_type:complete